MTPHIAADPALPLSGAIGAGLLLACALVLGGGGSPAPLPELLLEWLALAVAAAWFLLPATRDAWRKVPGAAWLVCLFAAAVPIVQLVPLPPALWHALPGREAEIEALSLIGRQDTWRPLTMAADRTLASLLSLLPPLVLLVVVSTLPLRTRLVLALAVVLAGLASLTVGTIQLTASPDSLVQFYGVTTPTLRGFQANHNATADLLLAALIGWVLAIRIAAIRGYLPNRAGPVLGLSALGIALFSFGVFFTTSRMGIGLLPLAILAALALLKSWMPQLSRKTALGALALAAVLAIALVALLQLNPAMARIGQRFSFDKELRVELWKDGLYTARKHYPVGVGMGNFVPALVAEERLEVVRPAMPNRAHNEYVELSVEAGLFGLIAWAAVIALIARAALQARLRANRSARAEAMFAGTVLAVLALHSMVDYPFRSMALAAIGALCAAMLLANPIPAFDRSNEKDHE
ncbi:MAG: O-antigen ligase family protein [Novosphingobium sp.]|uniref:O-antigen ligase family protein n=1 Tax=Novosphingobium sp. TaxID=1874826 RepID=UPI0032BE52E8